MLGVCFGLVGTTERWELGGRVVGVFGVPKMIRDGFESEVLSERVGIIESWWGTGPPSTSLAVALND